MYHAVESASDLRRDKNTGIIRLNCIDLTLLINLEKISKFFWLYKRNVPPPSGKSGLYFAHDPAS